MSNGVSVIITHRGNPPHLKYVLDQLCMTNHEADVVLLGDRSNSHYSFLRHAMLSDYFSLATEFRSVYKHMNTTDYEYWIFCYQRWFAIYEYMERWSIERIVAIDSDVLVYEDLSNIADAVRGKDAYGVDKRGIEDPGHWIAGPPLALLSRERLRYLLEFFKRSYEEEALFTILCSKMKFHEFRNEPYGICDMAQMYLFQKENPDIVDLFQEMRIDGEPAVIDKSILDVDGFVPRGKIKKIDFSHEGKPFCYEKGTNRKIFLPIVHFQGYSPFNSKLLIRTYYTGRRFRLQRYFESSVAGNRVIVALTGSVKRSLKRSLAGALGSWRAAFWRN
jgi:hypothetical protein